MGLTCCCVEEEDPDIQKKSKAIDKEIANEKASSRKVMTVLILGTSESGKSTVLKQMKIVYANDRLSKEDLHRYKEIINQNVVFVIQNILEGMISLKITIPDDIMDKVDLVLNYPREIFSQVIPFKIKESIDLIWKSKILDQGILRANEFQLLDSFYYWYPSEYQRVFSDDFIPTLKDVLNSRETTIGIHEHIFNLKNTKQTLRIIDVGGQRSQRNKWLQLFAGANAVIYVSAVIGYSQLEEDKATNRLIESLTIFDSICNNSFLRNVPVILFLNKIDLLPTKLKIHSFKKAFPNYEGNDQDQNEVLNFLKMKFVSLYKSKSKQILVHFTHATEVTQLSKVIKTVLLSVLQNNLASVGLQ